MTLAESFDARRNSLNAIRLAMAVIVVVSHTPPTGGFGPDPLIGQYTFGGIAVAVFFALSGYLITRSADQASGILEYLWHRFLRIYPAAWLCLIVIAFVLAPIAYSHSYSHGQFGGFEWSEATRYTFHSATIAFRNDFNISESLTATPFFPLWNGPLSTLAWELGCYLAVAVLMVLPGTLRLRVTLAAAAVWAWLLAHKITPEVVTVDPRLPIFFAAGALLFVWADHVAMRWWVIGPSAALLATTLYWGGFFLLGALPLAVLALHIAFRFPTSFASKNDLSYGIYIYAWPIQQVLANYGYPQEHGPWLFFLSAMMLTAALAAMSWFGVERPLLALKRARKGRSTLRLRGRLQPGRVKKVFG